MSNFVLAEDLFCDREDYVKYTDEVVGQDIQLGRTSPVYTELSLHSHGGYIDWQPLRVEACSLFSLKLENLSLDRLGTSNPFWRFYRVSGDVNWETLNKLTFPIRQRIRDKALLESLKGVSNEQLLRALALRTLGVP